MGITYTNGAGTTTGNLTYTRDPGGRIAEASGSLARTTIPGTAPAVIFNNADQVTSVGGTPLTYDNNGNLTNDGALAYTWNARDELTGVTKTGLTESFTYDAAG